jgi:hypothetical protein
MSRFATFLTGTALLLSLACGGGSGGGGSTPASKLTYTFTPADTDWRLVKDEAASDATHLYFDLLAPTGASGDGYTLILTSNAVQASWLKVDGSSYATQSVFTPANLKLNVASVSGGALRIAIGQAAGTGTAVTYDSGSLARVGLQLTTGAPVGTVALTATAASHLAGAGTDPVGITVQVGTLKAE